MHRDMLNRQMLPFFLARTCVGAWMVMRCNLLGGAIVFRNCMYCCRLPRLTSSRYGRARNHILNAGYPIYVHKRILHDRG